MKIIYSLFVSLFVCFIFSCPLLAQEETQVRGVIEGNKSAKINLEVYTFNVNTLQLDTLTYESLVKRSGEFTIKTNSIRHPYTNARLILGTKNLSLILSPGDILKIQSDYMHFKDSVSFSGKGSEYNRFLKELDIHLSSRHILAKMSASSVKDWVDTMDGIKDSQEDLLNLFLEKGIEDTLWVPHEQERIHYSYLSYMLNEILKYKWDTVGYANTINRIDKLCNSIVFADYLDLVEFPKFRRVVWRYIEFKLDRYGKNERLKLNYSFELADSLFTGKVKHYYLLSKHKQLVKIFNTLEKRKLLDQFFISKISDIEFSNLIYKQEKPIEEDKITKSSSILKTILMVNLALIVLGLIVVFNALQKRWSSIQLKKRTYPRWIMLIIGLFIIFMCIVYLIESSGWYSYWPYLMVLSVLLFVGINAFILWPNLLQKSNKSFYIGLFILISLCFLGMSYFIRYNEYYLLPGRIAWIWEPSLFRLAFKNIGILLWASLLVHYLMVLAKKRRGFLYLFKHNLVNSEAMAHGILVSVIFLNLASRIGGLQRTSAFIYFILGAGVFYFVSFISTPKFLIKKLYIKYSVSIIIVLLISAFTPLVINALIVVSKFNTWGIQLTWEQLRELLGTPDYKQLLSIFLLILPATLYAYVRAFLLDLKIKNQSHAEKTKAELIQLQSQVNPHFLFNSLNTLYSIALHEKSEETAESITSLANLMRYLIDDMDKEKIPLIKEIGYIEDYIQLQLMRSSAKHKIEVELNVPEDSGLLIAPMLLIPFVENALKHGINPNKSSELIIQASIKEDECHFLVENSKDTRQNSLDKEKGLGIGIENVRRRLDLLYPKNHDLTIIETANRFTVFLKINLK